MLRLFFPCLCLIASASVDGSEREKEDLPLHMRFKIFHVVNPTEVVTGASKAKFEERGPYTYRVSRDKRNVNNGGSYVDFELYREFEYIKELSCEGCEKTDSVRILNMPLIGAVAGALDMGSIIGGSVLNILAGVIDNTPDSKDLFLEDTVDNILFTGVNNDVVDLLRTNAALRTHLPPAIQDNGFAIFNSKNATSHNECYREVVSEERNSEILMWGPDLDNLVGDLSTIRTCPSTLEGHATPPCGQFNFKPWWHYPDAQGEVEGSPCNLISGSRGEEFPPNLQDRLEDDLWIFTTDLCRSLAMKYLEDNDVDGVNTVRYSIPKDAWNINKTNNVCFCPELAQRWDDSCIQGSEDPTTLNIQDCGITSCHDGLLDVSECMLSPVVMSFPHFYLAEQQLSYFDAESGLAPSESEHMTYFDIEPVSGIVLTSHKRFQVNMPLKPTGKSNIVFLENIQDIPAFPVVWIDDGIDILAV